MTKTLRPILVLSVTALTLLSGCAKGDANTAWSKTKKEIKNELSVKSWDHCAYSHADIGKFLKTEEAKEMSEEEIDEQKELGNSVGLYYVFTLDNGDVYSGIATYRTKSKDFDHYESKNSSKESAEKGYEQMIEAIKKSIEENGSYCTYGELIK